MKWSELIAHHGSERKAAKALGMSRSAFNNHFKKLEGLCITSSCKSEPLPDKTRCRNCLDKAKTKKSKEEIYQKNKLYYAKNKEKLKEYNKEYQKKNLDKFRKARKKYDSSELGKMSTHRRRARRRAKKDFTMPLFDLQIVDRVFLKCFKCGSFEKLQYDHHIPLNKGGVLSLENTVKLCKRCNSAKQDRSPEEFYNNNELGRLNIIFSAMKLYKSVESPKEYEVRELEDSKKARDFIRRYHYSKSCPGVKYAFGLYYGKRVLGVCVFSRPSRQNITAPNVTDLIELSRLFVIDGTPKNTESYFVGKCLKWLKKNTEHEAVVSFADPTEGHTGIIYKASNFQLLGKTKGNYHYLTVSGERLHKRQVWDRSRKTGLTEKAQAAYESLEKVPELEKYKYIYYLK